MERVDKLPEVADSCSCEEGPVKLSKTARAAVWLEQFEVDDRAAAVALLDAVRFVPGGEVIAGVRRSIERLISENPQLSPVVLVPVLAEEDMRRANGVEVDTAPTVFREFDPAQPINNEPGSEALMAQLIREVRRGSAAASIVPSPLTLEAMKQANVRTLVCVTDYIGSGKQVLDYAATWNRHPTVKSWRSFGWLRIVVVAYASTPAGRNAIKASSHVDAIEVIEMAPGIDELRKADVNGNVEEVCRVYAKRGRLWPALGYRDSAGLFASSFSVPNNLPAILIRRSKRWTPFFDGRSVSASLSDEIGAQRPDVDVAQQLRAAGQVRLAARHRDAQIERRWQTHLAVLGFLPRAGAELALALGVDMPTVSEILTSLERADLIDGTGKLTPAGRTALNYHRLKRRRVSASLTSEALPYYPRYKR